MAQRLTALVTVVLVLSGCEYGQEGSYSGDGVLEVLHRMPRTAIKIDFEEFQLDQAFHARYDVQGLPALHWDYFIGLAVDHDIAYFHTDSWPDWVGCEASVRFSVYGADGSTMLSCGGQLCQFNWHTFSGDTPFARARGGQSGLSCDTRFRVDPRNTTPAEIEITYEPTSESPSLQARARIMSDSTH